MTIYYVLIRIGCLECRNESTIKSIRFFLEDIVNDYNECIEKEWERAKMLNIEKRVEDEKITVEDVNKHKDYYGDEKRETLLYGFNASIDSELQIHLFDDTKQKTNRI